MTSAGYHHLRNASSRDAALELTTQGHLRRQRHLEGAAMSAIHYTYLPSSLVQIPSMPKPNIELPNTPKTSSKFRESHKADVGTPDLDANHVGRSSRSHAPLGNQGRRQSVTLAGRCASIKSRGTLIANSERHWYFLHTFRAPSSQLLKSLLPFAGSQADLQARTATAVRNNGTRFVPPTPVTTACPHPQARS